MATMDKLSTYYKILISIKTEEHRLTHLTSNLKDKAAAEDYTRCKLAMIHFTRTHQDNRRLMPGLVGNGMGRINKTDAASSHCASTVQVTVCGAIIRGILTGPSEPNHHTKILCRVKK